ncbi:hypothetical protein BC940DRAFT_287508 [Gongronella butleri]|nr:hypothetical protein BC940DRAFT_287508 [Gongronella butleri]
MSSSTLFFEAGIMKLSAYDPVQDRFETKTLELPRLMFEPLEMPSMMECGPLSAPVSPSVSRVSKVRSRFTEYFEVDPHRYFGKSPRRSASQPSLTKKAKRPRFPLFSQLFPQDGMDVDTDEAVVPSNGMPLQPGPTHLRQHPLLRAPPPSPRRRHAQVHAQWTQSIIIPGV